MRAARGEVRPRIALEQVPVVVNILCQNTGVEPMCGLMADADATAREPGVLTASVTEGYPYADVPETGMAAVVVTDGDPASAHRHARRLGESIWRRRDHYDASGTGVDDALRAAAAARHTPTLLLDVGDNIGGGSGGDSVVLLAAARRHRSARHRGRRGRGRRVRPRWYRRQHGSHGRRPYGSSRRPSAAAARHGTAAARRHVLGRGADTHRAEPLRHGQDGRGHDGVRPDPGAHEPCRDAGERGAAALPRSRPAGFCAVVAKGVQSPLAAYGQLAADVVQVDTPGVTSADLRRLEYQHRRRSLHPFEDGVRYPS